MQRVITAAGLAAMGLSVGACQSAPPAADEIPALMDSAGVPGLAIAWIEDGRVAWTGAYGTTRAGSDHPVTDETIFEAASLSKPVVAYATLRLVARGELDLDAPLWDDEGYPRLAHDERARLITPRLVLTHTTGLPNWGGTPLELNFDPGTSWNYSGEGFVYLATMLERRTGLALDELVEREVFEPLGMEHSSFVWRPDYDDLTASPHDILGRPGDKNRPEEPNAAASLHTTASDYARFVTAVMAGGGLPADLAAEMLEPQTGVAGRGTEEARTHVSWGLGWGIQDGERGRAFWHWGDNGNFRCFVIAYPDHGDGLVYFTNSNNGLAMAESVVEAAFGEEPWALRFVDYETWDQPRRQARIEIGRAFAEGNEDAGWSLLERLPSDLGTDVAEDETTGLGQALVREEQVELGLAVLEWGAEQFGTASSYQALAEARTQTGEYDRALAAYDTATALDPDLTAEVAPRMAWLREGIRAAETPFELDAGDLRDYIGRFGPRTIRSDGNTLRYSREGASSDVAMIPLVQDLFRLDGVPGFRIRFERGAAGRVVAIVGLYSDGSTDRTERSPLRRLDRRVR